MEAPQITNEKVQQDFNIIDQFLQTFCGNSTKAVTWFKLPYFLKCYSYMYAQNMYGHFAMQ